MTAKEQLGIVAHFNAKGVINRVDNLARTPFPPLEEITDTEHLFDFVKYTYSIPAAYTGPYGDYVYNSTESGIVFVPRRDGKAVERGVYDQLLELTKMVKGISVG